MIELKNHDECCFARPDPRFRDSKVSPRFPIRAEALLLWRPWLAALLLLAATLCSHAESVYPGVKWARAAPEVQAQWSAERLKDADEAARSMQTDAYLVVHRGYIVHEYGAVSHASNIRSVRKSILSVLMGIAADRGLVSLDATLAEMGIDDKDGLTPAEKQATVRQLMQARSGIYHRAAYETASMGTNRPERGSVAAGQQWFYNNWDFNALATIYAKSTGKTVFEALQADLAGPLQFENFNVLMDTKWQAEAVSAHPAYLMRLSAQDLARVGLLMARGGRWAGRQLVSARWVEESTASYSAVSARTGYGYMWWVGTGDRFYQNAFPGKVFAAEGSQGQFLVVDVGRDLVVVHEVNNERDPRRGVTGRQFSELLRRILSAKTSPD